MLPAHLKPLIARLDPGSLTSFVGGLLSAEVARLGMPISSLAISDQISDADEGLDAILTGVPERDPQASGGVTIPEGEVGFQLKAIRSGKSPSVLKIQKELSKPGPRRILQSGGTYVLVWSQDLNPAQQTAVLDELRSQASEITADPKVEIWDAQVLATLGAAHPGVATDAGLAEFDVAWSLPELLSTLRAEDRPFVADPARSAAIEKLAQRVEEARNESLVVSIHGDPGAGKTRLVAHALDTDRWRDSVLYVRGENPRRLLTTLRRDPNSTGIIILDEVSPAEIDDALATLGGTDGRWRVVSVSSRQTIRYIAEGPRDIVLHPLSEEAMQELVINYSGLDESQARRVAEVSAGFPELAFRLSEELSADPTLDLVSLARTSQPERLLSRLLDDDATRRALGPLALFSAVGFEGEVRYEMSAVAETFELSEDEFDLAVSKELGRFVSDPGRYRQVTPLLVAVWLATDLFERMPAIADRIVTLPETLQRAFAQQLEYFGPSAQALPHAIAKIIDDERFRSPTDFDEAAGHFLRAAAAIVPAAVSEAISTLLERSTVEDLERLPRRDLIWALEVLLWWPDTWRSAIEAMYLLAQHETETWSNNASGQFVQFFGLFLSGTTIPFDERASWLRQTIESADEDDLILLADASASGLQAHHSRTLTGFRGGGQPDDWQPATYGEIWSARATAWNNLLSCYDRSTDGDTRKQIVDKAAQAVRIMYASRRWSDVEESLHSREWTAAERSSLAEGVRRTIRYETDLPDEAVESGVSLEKWLLGQSLEERLDSVLRMSYWDLLDEVPSGDEPPRHFVELADEVIDRNQVALALASRGEVNEETRFRFLRYLATRITAPMIGEESLALQPPDWVGVSAALSVADEQDESEWASELLHRIVDLGYPEEIPKLLTYVIPTSDRLSFALDLVHEGRASPEPLSGLLYGARTANLDEQLFLRLVEQVAAAGRLEHALGMLHQWLEQNEPSTPDFNQVLGQIGLTALEAGGGTMTDHHLEEIIKMDLLEPEQVLAWWQTRLIKREGLPHDLDTLLTSKALATSPDDALNQLLDLIQRQAHGEGTFGLFSSSELALLSRAADVIGHDAVWTRLKDADERTLRWALHHMSWKGEEPHPLVYQFLVSNRLDEFRDEARACFFNTLGVVTGPFYRALERELQRAESWEEILRGTAADAWARDLIGQYQRDIEWHRQREAEEDVRLR
jgi:hypothetical protein